MTSIILKIRHLIQDNSISTSDIFTYGSSKVFTLSESNVNSVVTVYRNDVSNSSYTYNSTTKKVTYTGTLTAGDTVQIDFTYYPNYSDTEIQSYIHSALVHLSNHNYEDFTVESGNSIYPELTPQEETLVALIASILIEPDNKTIKLPDIRIETPNDLPTYDKIAKVISSFKHNIHGIFELLGDEYLTDEGIGI
jgi:hypothetical protein